MRLQNRGYNEENCRNVLHSCICRPAVSWTIVLGWFWSAGMSLDKDTVARIARLVRLKVPEEELLPLAGELSGILAWIEQLNEVDTRNVEPMSSVSDVTLPMRADKVTDGGIAERVLANAPGGAVYVEPADKNAGGFFTVPKVVE
jgi:aspartyl-tRNA(Asn)/glutamyl-tRNA(Gln) amidotransferase subunit C